MAVSVWWLLLAFVVGGNLGFLLCAALTVARKTDELVVDPGAALRRAGRMR